MYLDLKLPRVPKIQEKSLMSFCKVLKKQMVQSKSNAKEVSFECSHHRISYTDSKVSTTLHVSIIDSGVKGLKTIENFNSQALKVVAVAYERWSLTRGFNYSDFTEKIA